MIVGGLILGILFDRLLSYFVHLPASIWQCGVFLDCFCLTVKTADTRYRDPKTSTVLLSSVRLPDFVWLLLDRDGLVPLVTV